MNRSHSSVQGIGAQHGSEPQGRAEEKEGHRMTIDELAREYEAQYRVLSAKVDGLKPLLCIYSGKKLYLLRKKIKTYSDMACECRLIASMLGGYYNE